MNVYLINYLICDSQIYLPVSTDLVTFEALGITATNYYISLQSGDYNLAIIHCAQGNPFFYYSIS